ncbi:hypothetical protein EPI10_023890 [Gossypium australe]|uniref:Uncharacterized protein n=1 Tax=Gossypium australe TaxID=47621 RepID=A0A5B6VWQ8_9ROSI|nr:hypothetical protein EPI10_023890 [Gossypium australe]
MARILATKRCLRIDGGVTKGCVEAGCCGALAAQWKPRVSCISKHLGHLGRLNRIGLGFLFFDWVVCFRSGSECWVGCNGLWF